MEQINTAERKKRLLQFGALYIGSLIALILTFHSIVQRRRDVNPPIHSGTSVPASAQRIIDSLRAALQLAAQPHPAMTSAPGINPDKLPKHQPLNRHLLDELRRQIAMADDSMKHLQTEKAAIRQKLDESQKSAEALAEQVANLHHSTEILQARVTESTHATTPKDPTVGAGESRITDLMTKNVALEKETLELADQLRFAEVDCNLSRADARQVVYNDRQRQDLLSEALHILNDLSGSSDPGVKRKAKEKLILLKNIADMVHD
jgi:hypothetical protein